jgi:hypothetical protein
MPTEVEVPRGARRDFIEQLFSLYREAHRPGLREISRAIPDDAPGTASTETIRRMLRGTSVSSRWETVDAVLTALCHLAGVDPDADISDGRGDEMTRREVIEHAWHEALDNPEPRRPYDGDPWGDPPF